MALKPGLLADELVGAFTVRNVEKTKYDATTGEKTTIVEDIVPDRKKMEDLAKTLINHIKNNSEVKGVESSVSVLPGITVTTSGGPGSTTSTGSGNSQQSNVVKVQ